jgi:hypothetical protein
LRTNTTPTATSSAKKTRPAASSTVKSPREAHATRSPAPASPTTPAVSPTR